MRYYGDRINTASDYFKGWVVRPPEAPSLQEVNITTPEEYHNYVIVPTYRNIGGDPSTLGLPADVDEALEPARAIVNHGRWLIVCPGDSCFNAMLTHPGWPFMCAECGSGGMYRHVEWPEEVERAVATLLERPLFEQRSWDPEEQDIESLEAETVRLR